MNKNYFKWGKQGWKNLGTEIFTFGSQFNCTKLRKLQANLTYK